MADDQKRRRRVSEALEKGDAAAIAAVKRQRTGEKEEHAGGDAAGDVGEDILAWLTDLDEQSVRDLMANLFEPTTTPSPSTAAAVVNFSSMVSFSDVPRLQPSSYVTINTENEETCGSSFSYAPSVMAGFDASGLGPWGHFQFQFPVGTAAGGEMRLQDDDVLARFLGEDAL